MRIWGFERTRVKLTLCFLIKMAMDKFLLKNLTRGLKSGEKFQNINDKSRYHKLKKAVDLFKKYDVDNSQALDREEFKRFFKEVGGKATSLMQHWWS